MEWNLCSVSLRAVNCEGYDERCHEFMTHQFMKPVFPSIPPQELTALSPLSQLPVYASVSRKFISLCGAV